MQWRQNAAARAGSDAADAAAAKAEEAAAAKAEASRAVQEPRVAFSGVVVERQVESQGPEPPQTAGCFPEYTLSLPGSRILVKFRLPTRCDASAVSVSVSEAQRVLRVAVRGVSQVLEVPLPCRVVASRARATLHRNKRRCAVRLPVYLGE